MRKMVKKMKQTVSIIRERYLPLIKPLQTGLLLVTGLAGFMSAKCPWQNPLTVMAVAGSLFLAISGSTILNMWYDQDIDKQMGRTTRRPIPSGMISSQAALRLGLVLSILGVGWAARIDGLYALVVFAGLFFDVVVYTIWLKRRSESIGLGFCLPSQFFSGFQPIFLLLASATGEITS
jgi:protoheme IX farnesyltransferase